MFHPNRSSSRPNRSHRLTTSLLAAAAAAVLPASARADDQVFTPTGGGTSGDFNNPANWFDANANSAGNSRVPTPVDRADIASSGSDAATVTATFGTGLDNPSATMNTLYIGANVDGPAGLPTAVGTGTDNAASTTFGNGVLTQNSGALTVNTWTVIGENSSPTRTANIGTGTYNLQGGSFHQAGTDNVAVGQGGTGTFNVSNNATVLVDSNVNIGRWSTGDNHGQGQGNGTMTQSNTSTVTVTGELAVGREGIGQYTINDTAQLSVAGDFEVGRDGSSQGTFTQNGGTVTAAANGGGGWLYIGRNGGSTGTYNMNGGTLTTNQRLMVGTSGNGTFIQKGGTVNVSGSDLTVGDAGGTGNYQLSGGVLNATNAAGANIGGWTGANGTMTVSGTGQFNVTSLSIGRNDPNDTSNTATNGTVTQTGGAVTVSAALTLGGDPATETNGNSHGTYNLSGGTLTLGTGGLTLGVTNAFMSNGKNSADFGKSGTGAFTLSGTGVLDANRSTLAFGAGTANGTFTFTGGRLQNATAVQFFLNQQGGTFEAGKISAPAATSITGNGSTGNAYTLAPGATLQEDIEGTSPSSADSVNATSGLVTITGGTLAVHVKPGFTVPTGTQYAILTSDAPVTGTFAQGFVVTADNGQRFTIAYNTLPGGGTGNDVVLTAQAVPEPAVLSLAALAAGAGLLRRRRR